jgi:hypothetical protein
MAFVYVLSNRYMPGMLKIGFTARSIEERMAELYTTGVPAKFNLEIGVRFTDQGNAYRAEQSLHRKLGHYRVNGKDREYFEATVKDVAQALRHLIMDGVLEPDAFFGPSAESLPEVRVWADKMRASAERERKLREEVARQIALEELAIKERNTPRPVIVAPPPPKVTFKVTRNHALIAAMLGAFAVIGWAGEQSNKMKADMARIKERTEREAKWNADNERVNASIEARKAAAAIEAAKPDRWVVYYSEPTGGRKILKKMILEEPKGKRHYSVELDAAALHPDLWIGTAYLEGHEPKEVTTN